MVLVIFGIAFLKLRDFNFLNLDNPDRVTLNKFPFVVILSLIIAIILIFVIEKRLDFWTFFNFSWVSVLAFIFCQIFITDDDYTVFDYTFSEKISNHKTERYDDEGIIKTQKHKKFTRENLISIKVSFKNFIILQRRINISNFFIKI